MSDLIDRQQTIDAVAEAMRGLPIVCKDIAEKVIKQLPSVEPHWIPVTQALPEDDTVVLVCGKSGGIYTAIHNNSKTWIRGWWKMNSKNHHCNPTAWMELPSPYKGEKNDNI